MVERFEALLISQYCIMKSSVLQQKLVTRTITTGKTAFVADPKCQTFEALTVYFGIFLPDRLS
jgi:hypothetical protein